ncbi:sterol desaturase family protein [Catenovulum sediminis]|uniref:Sterol desaturase family protein n=1 Tax=Catenovulum sediminis TaxID=1740262 RepID=A0ABV1RIS6_9ALTE|nr:sterol desaturase family protein [Catenovulum sediminis]
MNPILNWLDTNVFDMASNLLDANKRIYLVYLLSALLIASATYLMQKPAGKLHQYLFNRKIWWHKSAQADYKLMLLNRIIKALMVTPFLFGAIPIALFINESFSMLMGPAQRPSAGTLETAFIFTVILFILDDFSRFILHYALHKIPALWAFHKVHHSAQVLTPLTIYRTHPLESALYAMRMTLVQGSSIGISLALFGPALTMIDILGANLFIFLFNLAGSNLRHSHVWLSWGKYFEHIFISPAQHQLHHSKQAQHFDCNFGTTLACWDILFKSLITAPKKRPFKLSFGIKDQANPHQLPQLYFTPFYEACPKSLRLSLTQLFKNLIRLLKNLKAKFKYDNSQPIRFD